MIQVQNLTKRYGNVIAVDDLTFQVEPGVVTALLGPNGAGKSTTMRMLLGLDRPGAGTATIDGRSYRQLRQPLTEVGSLLDANWVHPRRSVRAHLHWQAVSNGIPTSRVGEVLGQVGLESATRRLCGQLSLGMRQRLGLAGALLGNPRHLILDEPANGLDPEGIAWLRRLLQDFAAEGRSVLLSSHLLAEVAQTADNLIVIARGRLSYSGALEDFTSAAGGSLEDAFMSRVAGDSDYRGKP